MNGAEPRECSDLETIADFAEKQGISIYEICIVYGRYKAINREKAFERSMKYIYDNSE